jgi:hypothetical protein
MRKTAAARVWVIVAVLQWLCFAAALPLLYSHCDPTRKVGAGVILCGPGLPEERVALIVVRESGCVRVEADRVRYPPIFSLKHLHGCLNNVKTDWQPTRYDLFVDETVLYSKVRDILIVLNMLGIHEVRIIGRTEMIASSA